KRAPKGAPKEQGKVQKCRSMLDIRDTLVLEITADDFFKVMRNGTVSTNVYLRRWHNFALDMNWLLVPVIPKNRWPAVEFKEKSGIILEEHQRIIARERNPERRAFYDVCWHVGGFEVTPTGWTPFPIPGRRKGMRQGNGV